MDVNELGMRAARHAALGDLARLTIVECLFTSDCSPKELGSKLGLASNLLTHHLDVLEAVGLIVRFRSAGDARRKYVRLVRASLVSLRMTGEFPQRSMLFLCSHNSARSQLASALWTARTGRPATSAGTHPASRVHRGAIAAARRAGLRLEGSVPRLIGDISPEVQVVTVCDRAHEELDPAPDWWHWSIPDPVGAGTPAAFDEALADLDTRITSLVLTPQTSERKLR